jgi:hypothetical protein
MAESVHGRQPAGCLAGIHGFPTSPRRPVAPSGDRPVVARRLRRGDMDGGEKAEGRARRRRSGGSCPGRGAPRLRPLRGTRHGRFRRLSTWIDPTLRMAARFHRAGAGLGRRPRAIAGGAGGRSLECGARRPDDDRGSAGTCHRRRPGSASGSGAGAQTDEPGSNRRPPGPGGRTGAHGHEHADVLPALTVLSAREGANRALRRRMGLPFPIRRACGARLRMVELHRRLGPHRGIPSHRNALAGSPGIPRTRHSGHGPSRAPRRRMASHPR